MESCSSICLPERLKYPQLPCTFANLFQTLPIRSLIVTVLMKFQNVSNNTHVTRPIEGVYECRKYFVKPRRWRQKPGHVEEPGEIPGYAAEFFSPPCRLTRSATRSSTNSRPFEGNAGFKGFDIVARVAAILRRRLISRQCKLSGRGFVERARRTENY